MTGLMGLRELSPWMPSAGFWVVSLVAVVLRGYKAHATGIVHDEALTFQIFGQSVIDAWSLYPFSNNHVVNSLLINISKPLAAMSDNYIRIPSFLFTVAFVSLSAVLCRLVIVSVPVGLACHAAIVFAWYPLDLSFQARGYGAAMACNLGILCILASLATALRPQSPLRAAGVGALFGLSVAVLLTNVQYAAVAALVYAWVLFRLHQSPQSRESGLDRLGTTGCIAAVTVAAVAAVAVVLVTYWNVISQIQAFFKKPVLDYEPAVRFFGRSFGWWFLHSLVAGDVGTIVLVAAACGLLVVMGWSAVADLRGGAGPNGAARRVLMTTIGGYVLLLVVLNYGIGMSLGFARNRVDVFLFFLLAGALAMDHAVTVLRQWSSRGGRLAEIAAAAVMCAFAVLLLPRLDYIYTDNVAYQSAIGPFIRQAVAAAPDREWRFRFSPQVNFCAEIVEYYAAVRPAYRVRVCEPRYGTHMGVSGPQVARDWKAAVTTKPPNVYVSRSREPSELSVDAESVARVFMAGLRFECPGDDR